MKYLVAALAFFSLGVAAAQDAATTDAEITPIQTRDDWYSSIDVAISDAFAQFNYNRESADVLGLTGKRVTLGLFLNEDNSIVPSAGLEGVILEDVTPIQLWVGSKVYLGFLASPDDDIFSVAFGARARWELPLDKIPFFKRFTAAISSNFYYGPEITTSGSGVNVVDSEWIKGEIDLTERLTGTVGARVLKFEKDGINDPSEELADELFVGFIYKFAKAQ